MTSGIDALSTELVRLEGDLDQATTALQEAKRASRDVRSERRRGRPYREIVRSGVRPVELVRAALDRLRPSLTRLRRAEMAALRSEGSTTTDIAEQFGITHQRVSKILSADGPTD